MQFSNALFLNQLAIHYTGNKSPPLLQLSEALRSYLTKTFTTKSSLSCIFCSHLPMLPNYMNLLILRRFNVQRSIQLPFVPYSQDRFTQVASILQNTLRTIHTSQNKGEAVYTAHFSNIEVGNRLLDAVEDILARRTRPVFLKYFSRIIFTILIIKRRCSYS